MATPPAVTASPSRSTIATEDARYKMSSQFRYWSLSPVALSLKRQEVNHTARNQISARLQQMWDLEEKPPEERKMPIFLTPEEELKLVNFNTNELLRAGKFLGFGKDILATGAILFRRFYMANSIMTYPPTQILKTCLFFAAKNELGFSSVARRLEQLPNTTAEEVIAGESILAMANKFAYDVRHPFRALEGAVFELRRLGCIDEKRLETAKLSARDILKFSSLITDTYFHFTPSQIMLAAFSIVDRALAEMMVNTLFQPPLDEDGGSGTTTPESSLGGNQAPAAASMASMAKLRDKVMGTIEACRDMLKSEPLGREDYWSTGAGSQETKPLRRKLKFCHDPDRWDLLKLQQMRRDQVAMTKEKDMDGRPDAKRRKVEMEDPFGPALK